MTIERFIFIAITLISVSSILYIPRGKFRIALVAFLSFQATTWCVSMVLAQTGQVVYPIREFVKATSINFIPQFLFYPMIFMWFILLFPKGKSIPRIAVHYLFFVSCMFGFIYFTAVYTGMYNIPKANSISTIIKGYVRNLLQYIVCHLYVKWFFANETAAEGDAKCI